jgi:hypothetical protein
LESRKDSANSEDLACRRNFKRADCPPPRKLRWADSAETRAESGAAGVGLDRVSKQADFCGFGAKSIRKKREMRSKALVNPQNTPSGWTSFRTGIAVQIGAGRSYKTRGQSATRTAPDHSPNGDYTGVSSRLTQTALPALGDGQQMLQSRANGRRRFIHPGQSRGSADVSAFARLLGGAAPSVPP